MYIYNVGKSLLTQNGSLKWSEEMTQQQLPSFCTLRSETPQFKFKEHCLFCGEAAKCEKKKHGNDVFPVRTSDFQNSIFKICAERKDDWGILVATRLASAINLHAADALCHQRCSVNFRTLKSLPQQDSSYSASRRISYGRPEDLDRSRVFQQMVTFLRENDDEQLTITDLIQKMQEFLKGSKCHAYSQVYMKQKLKEQFGDDIIIITFNRKPDVVTFRSNASAILIEFYKEQRKKDSKSETMRIFQTAAKLIRNDINRFNADFLTTVGNNR